MVTKAANLVEIFASAQGEGPNVGRTTVFVRLGECDLRCAWCDSPGTWKRAVDCRIEVTPGSGEFETVANPVAPERVAEALERYALAPGGFVSLTGGEPLLQPDAVLALCDVVHARGDRVHLETHGLAVAALERVVAGVDVVSMDWKLASDVVMAGRSRREQPGFAPLHRRFLEIAHEAADVHVKVVLTPNTTRDELEAVARAVAEIAPEAPLILQPVTPFGGIDASPSARVLLDSLWACERLHGDVRLIPQTHRAYGAL